MDDLRMPWNDPLPAAMQSTASTPVDPNDVSEQQVEPRESFFHKYALAGFGPDLLPIIAADGALAANTTVTAANQSKTPGTFFPDEGVWKGRGKWNERDATSRDIETWSTWPGAGVGIRTKRITGVDIDVTLEPLAVAIEKTALDMLGAAPCRIGQAPKRLLVYRVALPGKIRIAFKHPDTGDVQAVEILADGQMFVSSGIHGKTGRPYTWHRGSPATLGLDGLTLTTYAEVQVFRAAVAAHMTSELGPLGYVFDGNTETGQRGESRNDGVPATTEVSDLDRKRARQLIADIGGPVPESQRHNTILYLSREIKDLIGDHAEYLTLMHEAWQECAPDYTENEFESTRDSAWRSGENRPGSKAEAVAGAHAQFNDVYEAFVDSAGRKVAPTTPEEAAKLTLGVFIGDRYSGPAAKRKIAAPPDSGVSAKGEAADNDLPPLSPLEWETRDLPDPDYLLGSWLHTTSRTLIVGATGLGKTNFLLALAAHMAAGKPFLNWPARRSCRVLYVDGEMSNRLLKQRVADACRRLSHKPTTLFTLSHEDVKAPPVEGNPTGGLAPLNTPAGQAYVERLIQRVGGIDFIIFDNIMSLLGGEMKETEPWQKALPWMLSLTKRGIGQAWAHHTGHDESRSYGDKSREWGLDTVIHLTGAKRERIDVSFDLCFRKARERTPDNRAEFADIRVGLEADRWIWGAVERKAPGKVSPKAQAMHAALLEVLDASPERLDGYPAARMDAWREMCITRGLIDGSTKKSAQAIFSRGRAELVSANLIHVDGDLVRLVIYGSTADSEDWDLDKERLS